jgi:cephalosporin-C deacetylase-like acetyl esterase
VVSAITLISAFLCSPKEGGNLRPGVSNFSLIDGEFDKMDVYFWKGMTCEVLKNKDFDPTGKPTIVFYHGFPDNQYSFVDSMRHFNKMGYNVIAPPLRGYQTKCIPNDGDMSIASSA